LSVLTLLVPVCSAALAMAGIFTILSDETIGIVAGRLNR